MKYFHVEKLRNIVGQGGPSPYQITVSSGPSLGMIGTVVDKTDREAANSELFNPESANTKSALRRIWSALV